MNAMEKEAILNELIEELGLLPIRPYEITAADLADRSGLSVDGARRKLRRLVQESSWRCGYRRKDNRRCLAFWRAEDEQKYRTCVLDEEVV